MPLLFVVAFVVGTLSVAFDIAWNTLFVAVARREQYVEANSLLNGSRSSSSVGGPAIGGMLIQFLRAPIALVCRRALVRRVGPLPRATPGAPSRRSSTTRAASAASSRRGSSSSSATRSCARPSSRVATLNFFNYCFQGAVRPVRLTTYLRREPGLLGLALGAGAVGGVLGA